MTFWNVDLSMLCMHDSYHNLECSKKKIMEWTKKSFIEMKKENKKKKIELKFKSIYT